ncbi:uncharacterized protein LOC134691442 [Mytilus trossulus]|uniref:uncharacterized protein LOC134691442 n=1 Tax=Mytilus trossulus TaxID=6551 RepID=UPI003004ABBE
MADATSTNCTVCEAQSAVKAAVKWCSECEETFCFDCLKYHSNAKSTKSHAVIDVSDQKELPDFVLKIKQHCGEHGSLFQNYCLSHEQPCCRKCINSTHKNCIDMPPLDDVIKDVSKSAAVEDIQKRLQNLKEYYERLCQEKEENAKEIKTQSKAIIAHVMFIRLKLNRHLDWLESDVLKKVSEQENNALQKMGTISRDLKGKEDTIGDLYKGFIKMQNHASELQIFLGTKEFELEVRRRENEIEELTKDDSLDIKCIVFQENIELASFTCDVSSFGDIGIQITPSTTIFTKPKEQQAQTTVEKKKIDDINLKLLTEVKFAGSYICGCAILEDDALCIAGPNTKTLLLKNTNESLMHKITLPDKPYDITYVNEHTLAVTTSNYCSTIFIVNLMTKKVEKTINTEYRCFGISFSNGNLIIHSSDVGLISLNIESGRITELGIGNKVCDSYVAMHDGKIYCTNPAGHCIQCYNIEQSLAWEFKDKSLIAPRGIAVDKKGMVYVGDQRGGNVLIISPDGSKHRVIKIDMIPRPRTLSFDKARTRLLICGVDGPVGIFVIT